MSNQNDKTSLEITSNKNLNNLINEINLLSKKSLKIKDIEIIEQCLAKLEKIFKNKN